MSTKFAGDIKDRALVNHNRNLFKKIIRVHKKDSAFTYFILESNEGLCFYSTLQSSLNAPYRDIEMIGSSDFLEEINHLLKQLHEKYPIEILGDEIVDDHRNLSSCQE